MEESPTQPALAVAIGAGSPSRGVERMEQQDRLQGSSGSPTLEVPPEVWIGQELRRIGDEFNSHYHTGRAHNQGWRLWYWLIVLLRRMIDGV
ncbi:bcl-2-like protein 11 [Amblyraja radiata]|uniref:bcl-2-like protein 11 n=1 Tax=Amblyraja radiata TaxID=386614 RepID=UPI0014025843|nr:bcl-2-like protein 11 [Amblyraja radiata]